MATTAATQTPPAPTGAAGTSLKGSTASSAVDGAVDMRCPDPSAHKTKSSALQDQASAAALYSTNPANTSVRNPLGADGKLSSASAATSLKHAQAHDLPSFPVVGIDTKTSAGTAALLANANFKSPEYPKAAQQSSAAHKAALLANDHKMAPLWQPNASAAGSKAALLAHKDGAKVNLWQHEPHAHGQSAATIAFNRQSLSSHPVSDKTEEGKKKALIAATGATSGTRQTRAKSNPAPPPSFPDSHNSAKNALSAATISHSASMKARPKSSAATDSNRLGSEAMEAARIQHSKVSREMYTEHPPVALEVEEKRHKDALKASAISMAKKMYDVQQEQSSARSNANSGALAAHNQQPRLNSEEDIKQEAMRYIGIQEAAQKLAAERLAKIGYDEAAQFRSYYGYEKPARNKLLTRRDRNRASSNPEDDSSDEDEFRSRRIRSQMSQLNKNLAQIDAQKREQAQKNLMAAAERKVQAQMMGIDKKVFDETGKMSPAMIEEWDAKARARAAANSEARLEHHGKVHIGHGKYMDQAEIEAIALARMQPTLDEINEKTAKRLAQEEEQRLELAEKKRHEQMEKERAAEIKAEEKHYKAEEKKTLKAKSAEERAAAKQEKTAEKEKKAEEKRIAKENKRKSKEPEAEPTKTTATVKSPPTDDTVENEDLYRDLTPADATSFTVKEESSAPRSSTAQEEPSTPASPPTSPTSPKSESKGIKGLFSKLRRRSRHSNSLSESADNDKEKGFIGGHALRNSVSESNPPAEHGPALSSHPVAGDESHQSDVSSLSSDSDRGRNIDRKVSGLSEYEEERDGFNENLAPPPVFATEVNARNSGSPVRDSKFYENL